jgi:hypothetical protein
MWKAGAKVYCRYIRREYRDMKWMFCQRYCLQAGAGSILPDKEDRTRQHLPLPA